MTEADSSPTPALFFDPHDQAIPLYTVAQLRELEAQAAGQLPVHTLMARAGAAAARYLLETAAHNGLPLAGRRPVWLAAGPGNNGGDALVCATALHQAGVAAEVCMPAEVKPDDAQWALAAARAAGVPISHVPPASFKEYGWLVDGLFGIGLGRPLEGIFAELAQRIAAHAHAAQCVLALDVPSGLDSDTGNVVGGGPAACASHTITFIGAKPGLYMTQGRDLAGAIALAPLGIHADHATAFAAGAASAITLLNAPALFAAAFPPRVFATHKGTYGTLAVVGGDTGMCGAPILAARAALYTGAGKVHVAFVGAGAPPYDPPYPELMLHSLDDTDDAFPLEAMDALALGCGMGKRAHAAEVLAKALALDVPKLIDADALNMIAGDAKLADALAARGAAG
ncbi:MAG: ADP-dependent NAD(P)H-hydrate dehydratase / NAD(P)H-hydrate epimerase, partial [Paraburkholderia sp.]|nr:ADP-dependent NAD(P)H-hydrate dehydratase / NAD(P)H-hydrate epimerase [Paraburkholderia sp.]